MKKYLKNFITFLFIFLLIAGFFSLSIPSLEKIPEMSLNELFEKIDQEKIKEVKIKGERIEITFTDNKKAFSYKETTDSFSNLVKNFALNPEKIQKIKIKIEKEGSTLAYLIPFLIPFLIIAFFIYFLSRQIQSANIRAIRFGESSVKKMEPSGKKIIFKDVGGVKEAKEELKEVVEFLKNPKKFTSLGAKIPKGVLLMGAAGTGKTLLARAVSGEANVPFFHISGSEFVELFVGVGASRVRDLFRKAKKNLPCIIFIDELDAVGRSRGFALSGGHEEREQTLNQILVEMDGFEPNSGLVILAATNRPDILDLALLRPGRFDRRIILDEPDIKDREEILEIYSQNKPLAKNISLKKIAERTPGFTGADLANMVNEAAILAAKRNKERISDQELIESIEKVLLGPERRSFLLSEKEKKITAYHEAGHSLVTYFLPNCDPVQKVSIIARGRAAGYTLKTPTEDYRLVSKSKFEDELAALLAGYVTEKEILKEITTGATNDLKIATSLARKLVTEYGMSALGPRTFGEKEELHFLGKETSLRDYSEKVAQSIDEEVDKFIRDAYEKAKEIIEKNKEKLERIVNVLLKKETIEKKEFEKIFTQ